MTAVATGIKPAAGAARRTCPPWPRSGQDLRDQDVKHRVGLWLEPAIGDDAGDLSPDLTRQRDVARSVQLAGAGGIQFAVYETPGWAQRRPSPPNQPAAYAKPMRRYVEVRKS